MNKFLLSAATASFMMAVPSLAAAQDDAGWYLRGNLGYGTHTDIDIIGDVVGDTESEGNATGSVGVGYEFDNNWRLEADVAQLFTNLGAIDSFPNSSAKLRTTTAMLNAIYDFDSFGKWEPYVGAGVGIARGSGTVTAHDFPSTSLGASGVTNVSTPVCSGVACSFKDGDTGLGWQLLAGLGYQISDNLTWDTQYRYLNTSDFDFVGSVAPALGTISAGAASFDNVGAHSVLTGFRYKFGAKKPKAAAPVAAAVSLPTAPAGYRCWDGCMALSAADCAPQPQPEVVRTAQCWDGSVVSDASQCPAQPETFSCWDGSLVYDRAQCPAVPQQTVVATNYNVCGPSPVAIFNVDGSKQAKSISRLGTLPEFGDSHGLTPSQFYAKLQSAYSANAGDRAYLNYLFKSIGYEGGFRDANEFMFSEETLPAGTRGMLGIGEAHHYDYFVLDTNDRDREAFRIQGANGTVVHFMKTCGNYMYACQ